MATKKTIGVQTYVEFDYRGTTLRGTVHGVRTIRRKGRRRELAMKVKGDPNALDQDVARIVPDEGRAYYTIGLTAVRFLRKATAAEWRHADEVVRGIDGHNNNARAERTAGNMAIARERGLHNLAEGDPIEVQFRTGPKPATFIALTGSGRVKFRHHGNTRFSYPLYVRALPTMAERIRAKSRKAFE